MCQLHRLVIGTLVICDALEVSLCRHMRRNGREVAMYRDLLVHVDGSSAGRRRLQFAKSLAHRTGARLSGLHVTAAPDVPLKFKPSQVAGAASEIALKLDSDARLASALFR